MSRTSLLTAATALVTLALAAPATAAPPANDNFANATFVDPLSQPAPQAYDATLATRQADEPQSVSGDRTVWFKWTPNLSGAAFAATCTKDGSNSDDRPRVYKVKD